MRARLGLIFAFLAFAFPAFTSPAFAVPAKIIILRHGEKLNGFQLCTVGVARALALAGQYLGKGAQDSLFQPGESPAAFHAITLHPLELVSPAAQTWSAPVVTWSAIPEGTNTTYGDTVAILNARTQQAAADVLTNPLYDGKIVVMVWEHKHIANKKMEAAYPGQKISLRQLLNLDQLTTPVPDTWKGENYDYFWIVTYGTAGSPIPTGFVAMKQHFHGTHGEVPHNDWGKPETLPKNSGCKS